MGIFWIVCMVLTMVLADHKGRSIGWFFLFSLFTGPLALIVVLLLSSKKKPADGKVVSPERALRELEQIRQSMAGLTARIHSLEMVLGKIKEAGAVDSSVVGGEDVRRKDGLPAVGSFGIRTDAGLEFGRTWLSRIGVAVLGLGLAFLISYSFQFFGPWIRIGTGFLLAGALFWAGIRMEGREQLRKFGRVLLGGAWAMVYFTVYAMHHFEASRVIADERLDLLLLVIVVGGMLVHVLRYKSETMTFMMLLVAYLTTTIGDIGFFTFFSSIVLGAVVLVLVQRFQWVRLLMLGVGATYLVHVWWILPQLSDFGGLSDPQKRVNILFLFSYWVLFMVGTHLSGGTAEQEGKNRRILASVSLANAGLFLLFAFQTLPDQVVAYREIWMSGLALVYMLLAWRMRAFGCREMYIADMTGALVMLTWAVGLHFLSHVSLLFWMSEVILLIFIGSFSGQRIYRYFGYALSLLIAGRVLLLGSLVAGNSVWAAGRQMDWLVLMTLAGMVMSLLSVFISRLVLVNTQRDRYDEAFERWQPVFLAVYGAVWAWRGWPEPWGAVVMVILGAVSVLSGSLLKQRQYRASGYGLFSVVFAYFLVEWIGYGASGIPLTAAVVVVGILFGIYYYVRETIRRQLLTSLGAAETAVYYVGLAILTCTAVVQYMPEALVSLGLGLLSVAALLSGFFGRSRQERLTGFGVLAITLLRVIFFDLAGMDVSGKIITLMALGAGLIGVSYVYNRYAERENRQHASGPAD